MRGLPYPVNPGPSYYDYPLSMATMYRGVPFPLSQFSPSILLNQGTRQGEAVTSHSSVLPTVSNTSLGAASSAVTGQGAAQPSAVRSAIQTGIKNELLPNSEATPSAGEFDPYNLDLVSPTVSRNLDAALSAAKSKDAALKTEIEDASEVEENNCNGIPSLRLIHLSRGDLLNKPRSRGVNLCSYTISEEEYDKMEEDVYPQRKMPGREHFLPSQKPATFSTFQPRYFNSQYSVPRPTVAQNILQAQVLPAQVDSQQAQPHTDINQSMKKRNEGWIGNAPLNHSYTSELPQQRVPASLCQVDSQSLAGPSFRESCTDVREKLLPSLYNNAFFSSYTPSGNVFYDLPCDRLPAATTQTFAPSSLTTRVLTSPTTTTSLPSSASTPSSPLSTSPFPSATTSTSVTSNASISTALVNPMTLLAETEECDGDGFPMVDDTDESEFSALDLAMLSDNEPTSRTSREGEEWV